MSFFLDEQNQEEPLLLVGDHLARCALASLEDLRQLLQCGRLPGADLGRMDPVLAGQLRERLLLPECRPHDLRLELSGMMLSHSASLRFYVFSRASLSRFLGPL
jgi:hypothetical protein